MSAEALMDVLIHAKTYLGDMNVCVIVDIS